MKFIAIILGGFVLIVASIFGYLWISRPKLIEVRNACDTFVSQYAPLSTPRIENSSSGTVLIVSFTPTKNEEVDRIISSAKWGNTILEVFPSHKKIKVSGLNSNGELTIPVTSTPEATEILKELCFSQESIEKSIGVRGKKY